MPFNFEFIFNKILSDVDLFILYMVRDLIHWVRTPTINSEDCLTAAKIKFLYIIIALKHIIITNWNNYYSEA